MAGKDGGLLVVHVCVEVVIIHVYAGCRIHFLSTIVPFVCYGHIGMLFGFVIFETCCYDIYESQQEK